VLCALREQLINQLLRRLNDGQHDGGAVYATGTPIIRQHRCLRCSCIAAAGFPLVV